MSGLSVLPRKAASRKFWKRCADCLAELSGRLPAASIRVLGACAGEGGRTQKPVTRQLLTVYNEVTVIINLDE